MSSRGALPTPSETEKLLIRRWLLWMQTERKLYNVNNRHQCLREPLHHLYIVQPFPQYAPHFYGCTICGQYHLCHLHELSCVIVTDPVAQRMTCLYSGQLLRQSEALVPNIYDDGHDDAPLSAGATVSRGVFSGNGSSKTCYTNMTGPRSNHIGRAAKRQARAATMVHKKLQQSSSGTPGTPETLETSVSRNIYVEDSGVALLAIDSETTTTGPNEDEALEIVIEMGGEQCGGGTVEDDEGYGVDDGWHMLGLYQTNANNARNVTYHSNYNYWNNLFSYLIDSDDCGDTPESGGGGGVTGHAAVSLPSIRHGGGGGDQDDNKMFLDKEVDDETLCSTSHVTTRRNELVDVDIDASALTMRQQQINDETGLHRGSETFSLNVLGDGVSVEIDECVSSIVRRLLGLQLRSLGTTMTALGQSRLHTNLSQHFSRLVQNMAILIYNSPVLHTIHVDRQSRVQRHRGGRHNTPPQSSYVPHMVILPSELCATLLLDLLTQSYYDQDAMGHFIDLWRSNPWLKQLRDSGLTEQLQTDDRKLLRKQQQQQSFLLYEKERLVKNAIDVKECFAHYRGHAFWVRNFILNYR